MRSGDTDRSIARSGLIDRHGIVALRRVAEHAGWLDPRKPLPEEEAVLAGLHPARESGHTSDDGYIAQGQHGERLLNEGHLQRATEVFFELLTRLGGEASYARAVVLGRLARCFYMSGHHDQAKALLQQALGVVGQLAPSEGLQTLRGSLQSELGEAFRALGQLDLARQALGEALTIAQGLKDLRAQGVELSRIGALALAKGDNDEALERCREALKLLRQIRDPLAEAAACQQLGAVFQERQELQEAETHFREAARIREQQGQLASAQQSWDQLAALDRRAGRLDSAEAWCRKSIDADYKSGDRNRLSGHLTWLADLLRGQPDRLDEARQLVDAAVGINTTLDPATAGIWQTYRVLADIATDQAAAAELDSRRDELQALARDCRQLHQYAPRYLGALARLGGDAGCARAVVLGRLARCFYLSGHHHQAKALLQQALGVVGQLAPSEGLQALQGSLQSELGEVFRALGQPDLARQALGEALTIAQGLGDLRGQGVELSRIGALALAKGDTNEALERCREALKLLRQVREALVEAATWEQLGAVLQERQQLQEAESHFREAARIREQGAAAAICATPVSGAEQEQGADPPFQVTIDEERVTDYGLDDDLLVDGTRERRIIDWSGEPTALSDQSRPMLAPCVRVVMSDAGAVRFCLPLQEPVFERFGACTAIRRVRREITVSGISPLLWRLIGVLDGNRCVAALVSEFPFGLRSTVVRALGALAATDVLDVSGRPVGRFVHMATKKGFIPAGGLDGDEVRQLVTDCSDDAGSEVPGIALSRAVPERLGSFYAMTRSRRSRRDFSGVPLSRGDFDALLHTACGVTGAMRWGDREVKLRAYPSSGGLYAVRIYPAVLRIEGLEAGIYRYRAVENELKVVARIDRSRFIDAMLPAEREMVAGAAVMICLTGRFARHEKKYGEGGYRMLVAEAGHISQSLVLAAVALGLRARPFGGVFDDLLNRDLGLDSEQEQFLLSVLVGHAGDRPDWHDES
jgi:SagB-type dehydrogenase family enzyme